MQNLADMTPIEIRVLGVLSEKQKTVPDTYPLSLNALVSGSNQKTSRDPVMEITEADVANAIDALRGHSLVIETSGGRVARYGHNIERTLQIPTQSVAIMTVLMLRGPQTAGELRLNCERMHRFADISTVEAFLHELRDRADRPLVEELPRQPGCRENRWFHTLSQELLEKYRTQSPVERSTSGDFNDEAITELKAELSALKTEVAELKELVNTLLSR